MVHHRAIDLNIALLLKFIAVILFVSAKYFGVTVFLVSFLQLKRKAFQMFRGVLILSLLLGEYEQIYFNFRLVIIAEMG